jgi:peptidyl-tRNA hydrolase
MQDVKMLILVRKDLGLKRNKLLSLVADSTLGFLVDNDESNRRDELYVRLSLEEAEWLRNGQKRLIGWSNNEEHLRSIAFKAELNGIPCHSIFDEELKGESGDASALTCLALGPCDWNEIFGVVGNFKSV